MPIDHSLQPERLAAEAVETDARCGGDDHERLGTALAGTLDERTVRYVLETRPHFEELRHAVGQVAGMLVLAAAGARTVTQDHPLFAGARRTLDRACDGIRAAQASPRARHHHRHLIAAMGALTLALQRAQQDLHLHGIDRERVDPVLEPLQAAYRHLGWAARALPGFELLSFDQACCAPQHGGDAALTTRSGRNQR
jgi:hypothetical protein